LWVGCINRLHVDLATGASSRRVPQTRKNATGWPLTRAQCSEKYSEHVCGGRGKSCLFNVGSKIDLHGRAGAVPRPLASEPKPSMHYSFWRGGDVRCRREPT
jgi:hypothetical protein